LYFVLGGICYPMGNTMKAKDLIVWHKISTLLTGKRYNVRKTLPNKRYAEQLSLLMELVNFWVSKVQGIPFDKTKIERILKKYDKE